MSGNRTVRDDQGNVGKRSRRKRMPPCNRMDRGCNITPRESGQNSSWSRATGILENLHNGGKQRNADFSVCAPSRSLWSSRLQSEYRGKESFVFTGYSNVLLRGLSPVRWKSYAGFLGDGGAVMRRCYPINFIAVKLKKYFFYLNFLFFTGV